MHLIFNNPINKVFSFKHTERYAGNALVSYSTDQFQQHPGNVFTRHSNAQEIKSMIEVLQDLGYDIDVIDWRNQRFIPKKKYQLFIDNQANMDRLASLMDKDCIKILYATTSYWEFNNQSEQERLNQLYLRKKCRLKPQRQIKPNQNLHYCDAVFLIGNETTKNSYPATNVPFFLLPISSVTIPSQYQNHDFINNNRNFLWIGSRGAVHKGLDLLLDWFTVNPDYQLSICGNLDKEPEFKTLYHQELFECTNIKYCGFQEVNGDEFKRIVINCNFVIYPTCAEGQAGSVITAMSFGCIPVVSKYSGIDADDIGFEIKSNFDELIPQLTKLSSETLMAKSHLAWKEVVTNHSLNQYRDRLIKAFIEVLK